MYLLNTALEVAKTTSSGALLLNQASAPSVFQYVFSEGDSQLQRWSSLIGIVTAIVGNILISFALNIQRYAHIKLDKEWTAKREDARNIAKRSQIGYNTTRQSNSNGNHQDIENGHGEGEEDDPLQISFHSTDSRLSSRSYDDQKNDSNYLQSPYWWGGIVLMTLGEAGNFLAYGFAPASIVSPLGVVALVSNCVIAPIMLKEDFRVRDFWGVVTAVAGAVTVVLSSKQQEKKLGPHEVWDAITTTEFEVYMAITIVLIAILVWISPKYGNRTILIDLGLVGLFGGYTALSTKGLASMLSYTLWRAFTTPVTYALLAVLIVTAVMQVKYVNNALRRFDSTQVIPVQFVMFTLSVIIGSAILYRDFAKATTDNVVKFVGGCLLTFFGVYLITSGRSRTDPNEDEELSDEEREERIGLTEQDPTGEIIPYTDRILKKSSTTRVTASVNGDLTNEEIDDEESRRSSRISFAEPSPLPQTPRIHSNSQYRASHHITTHDSTSPHSPRTEETPLLNNPWTDDADLALPTQAELSSIEPSKPSTSRPSTQGESLSHLAPQQTPHLPRHDKSTTLGRNSISRIMPGQLISPLSGGLSVVVADSLRRGVDSPLGSKSIRRHRASVSRPKSGLQKISHGSAEAVDTFGTSTPRGGSRANEVSHSLDLERENRSTVTRARSLSTTLGDLFRIGARPERPDTGNEEAGPSGS
ncbi:hypothetical protein OIDMADRAFT_176072 [Oidiodendron maius Zn]|uniref:DUF803-domain-containing protein n=1 Tax=Oidiodendron maius (strain Zn) TaxID=913774 RepID=A0A0C3D3U3_OIDMZ|nr:hypothetical protein OIDMADRAFT_176072 [Oidiodendron maius Zn]